MCWKTKSKEIEKPYKKLILCVRLSKNNVMQPLETFQKTGFITFMFSPWPNQLSRYSRGYSLDRKSTDHMIKSYKVLKFSVSHFYMTVSPQLFFTY